MRLSYILLISLSQVLLFLSNPPASQSRNNGSAKIDSLLTVISEANDDSVKVYSLIQLSVETGRNNYSRSLEYADQALNVAESSHNESLLANALLYNGTAYFNTGLIDLAAKMFIRYDEIARASGNKQNMALSKINLGAIQLSLEDWEKAKVLNLDALRLMQEYRSEQKMTSLPPRTMNIYNNLSGIYVKLGDLKQAFEYNELGIAMAGKDLKYYRILDMLLDHRTEIQLQQGSYEDALVTVNQNIDLNKRVGDKSGIASAYEYLGKLFEKRQNYSKALNSYKLGYKLSTEVDMILSTKVYADLIYNIYNKTGNSDSALKYLQIAQQFDKKIKKDEAAMEMVKQEIISHYNEQQAAQQELNYRKTIFLLIVVAAALILITIVTFLFIITKRKQRIVQQENLELEQSARQIAWEKQELAGQLEEREKQLTTEGIYKLQRNETIEVVVKELLDHGRQLKTENRKVIDDIVKELSRTKNDTAWKEFEVRFQQVYKDFYRNLQNLCPDLTTNERRLCAFLKLNMTTKEISSITGQSAHSINIARFRLRKKLNLNNSETGLTDFIAKI